MPARKLVLLLVALLIAGATVMLTRNNLPGTPGATVPGPDIKAHEILVASRDLPSGSLLKEGDLKWEGWSAEIVPEGYIIKGKDDIAHYIGGVVRYGLRTGEPVADNRIVKASDKGFMAAVIAPGMRAVSVSITAIGGVAGFVFPGDRVDVILTHQVRMRGGENSIERKVSETILTDVRVLALDQKTDDQTKEPKVAQTATLEVTSKQAERLALMPEMGTLSLALRSLANAESAPPVLDIDGVPMQALSEEGTLTWDSDVSNVVERPANRQGRIQHIQIMRGKEASEATFELHQ